MTLRHNAFLATTAAALFAVLTPQAFAAVDGEAVFDALAHQMSLQGLELSSDSVSVSGDNVKITNLKISVPEGDDGFQMEEVLLEDVEEAANGAYVVGRIAIPSFSDNREGMSFNFEGASIEGYYIGGPEEVDPIIGIGIYRALSIGAVEVSQNGNEIFTLDGITATMSPYEPGGTLEMEGKVKDFFIDFSKIPEPQVQASMAELGYSQMRGRMTGTGTWDTASGDLKAQETIELDDAATLNIDFGIGGYDAELIAAMKKMQNDMKGQSDDVMGMAMLGLMQQVEIGSISIELVDQSATGRILDFAAKQQGSNREAVVAQAKAVLPFGLAQLQNPEFAAKVTAAVGAFLDDPKSLKIVAMPPNPVPVAQIMAAAMSAPQSIIAALSVDVKANQ
ncbi:MAG: hypothetical protein WAU86_13960 [Oricola sp.]